MARIDLDGISHSYDQGRPALEPLTMSWEDGGAYALLGPSGCGKTTLLNIISGLLRPTQGRVLFDGVDVTAMPPGQRNIAQVFQFPIVYDTMTVYENLAFPLGNRGWKRAQVHGRVHEIAEILELVPDLGRRARGLSAEARQRISLGRGLVRPDVAAVLFDEPLTVIDPQVKWLLRRKLKQIHQQLKLLLVYVTHDQTEALTFADRVVVMTQGKVLQTGSAEQLFEQPAHRFVGDFIGTPGMNFLPCEGDGGIARIAGLALQTATRAETPAGASLALGVRPEYIELADAPGPNSLPARVVSARDEGTAVMVELDIGGTMAWARLRAPAPLPARGPVHVHLPPARCALYADDWRLA